MQVTINGESKYIPVSTVTVYKKPDTTFPFHCTSCGNTLKIIGGLVTKIYPILEPSDQLITIDTCRNGYCRAKYVFQEGQEDDSNIKVLLNPKKESQKFYCYIGGGKDKELNKILEYTKGQIYNYPSLSFVTPPYISNCMNPACTLTYQFTQLS